VVDFYIDGKCVHTRFLGRSWKDRQILGIRKSATSVLPFKFQELELVGAFPEHYSDNTMFDPHLLKIQTWKIPLSCQKWGPLNFEPIVATPEARKNSNVVGSMGYTEDVYQNVARNQVGIMSGTPCSSLIQV
jgi:hypothetical protein